MAKRSLITPLGRIASDELNEFGAGRTEGWLSEPSLQTSIQSPFLVIANRSVVVIIRWEGRRDPSPAIRIIPELSTSEGEITAVEWISIDEFLILAVGTSGGYLLLYSIKGDLIHKQVALFIYINEMCIRVCHVIFHVMGCAMFLWLLFIIQRDDSSTSFSIILVRNGSWKVVFIFSSLQIVYTRRMLRLRFREIKLHPFGGDSTCELCAVAPGIIARFDGSDIKVRYF